jgi:hypothetical protein
MSTKKDHARRAVAMVTASLVAGLAGCSGAETTRPAAEPTSGIELPASFIADRIFVKLALESGDTLDLYTDTGGGLFVLREVAKRLGWQDTTSVDLHDVAIDSFFPVPLGSQDERIPIVDPPANRALEFQGMLGQAWFADRVWTFDYASRKLLLRPEAFQPERGSQSVALGFQTDSTGKRAVSFPRISVIVDNDTLQLLFDTGATGALSPAAMQVIGDTLPAVRATSFITTEVFRRWRERHPDWRVIPDADETVPAMAMIEVPEIDIAGFRVGPVWFTERPDPNFHQFMSQWMDRRVDGALGGNAFRFFRVTLDYPAAVAHFVPVAGPGTQ